MDVLEKLKNMEEFLWINPNYIDYEDAKKRLPISLAEVEDAEKRLTRFAPYLKQQFPESEDGIIESPISEISSMKTWMEDENKIEIPGELFLKRDDLLPIAGSIKARGGIYEVLKHAETLAIKEGLLHVEDDYRVLAKKEFVDFFNQYTIQVGSTGNLGLSIGIISAKIGFNVIVHMSSDAKQWKKQMLRSKGVQVIEYQDDYSKAVEEGRKSSNKDPNSHFIDDENSRDLFLGYAVGGIRLKAQLARMNLKIDKEHPLVVYLPCGVGGGPGGVAYGLKLVFGDLVDPYFAEPTHSPCMLLGLSTGKHSNISVEDIGLDNKTEADGLAVGRPSSFVGELMDYLLKGEVTIKDEKLYIYLKALYKNENIFIEPSALAGFNGPIFTKDLYKDKKPVQILWSTGGSLVPLAERKEFLNR
ncbi:MAG: D-serine ammonia-lyase [Gudongella sp.]|nr:D-serine ammonia-lyase [Gudongella sp.]